MIRLYQSLSNTLADTWTIIFFILIQSSCSISNLDKKENEQTYILNPKEPINVETKEKKLELAHARIVDEYFIHQHQNDEIIHIKNGGYMDLNTGEKTIYVVDQGGAMVAQKGENCVILVKKGGRFCGFLEPAKDCRVYYEPGSILDLREGGEGTVFFMIDQVTDQMNLDDF